MSPVHSNDARTSQIIEIQKKLRVPIRLEVRRRSSTSGVDQIVVSKYHWLVIWIDSFPVTRGRTSNKEIACSHGEQPGTRGPIDHIGNPLKVLPHV
jgi:hypothetical protein